MATQPLEIKLFGKYTFDDVEVGEVGMAFCAARALSGRMYSVPGHRHLPGGLHCREAQVRHLCPTHGWPLPEEAFQEGPVPHCGEVRVCVQQQQQQAPGVMVLPQVILHLPSLVCCGPDE